MAIYLIDYENVNKDGLNGVSRLTEKDRVIIFYSAKADRMTFGLHRRLNETKAVIEYKRVDVGGHNALDFQLATYLGFLVSQDPSEEYCIVSNDRGFEYLAGFWRKPLYNVTRTREIALSVPAEERRQARRQERNAVADEEVPETMADFGVDDAEDGTIEPMDVPGAGIFAGDQDEKEEVSERTASSDTEPEQLLLNTSESLCGSESDRLPEEQLFEVSEASESDSIDGEGSPEGFGDGFRQQNEESPEILTSDSEIHETEQVFSAQEDTGTEETIRLQQESPSDPDSDSEMESTEFVLKEYSRSSRRNGRGTAFSRKYGDWKRTGNTDRLTEQDEKETVTEEHPEVDCGRVDAAISGLDLEESERSKIATYIGRYKTKLGLNNALVRLFGTQKAGEIYKAIKPLVRDKKGDVERKKPSEEQKHLAEEVKKLTADLDLTEEDRSEITSYVERYKTKQGLNNALVRHFRSQKAGEIYKVIKPLIRDKKGPAEKKTLSGEQKRLTEEVEQLTADLELTAEERKEIASYVQRYKTKQGVNNALVRRFRSQKAGEIYKVIKPLLKEKKGRNYQN